MRGQVIDGRFTIEHLVGEGGMGAVYRAVDGHSGARVAFKVLTDLSRSSRLRFEREAATLAELQHPGIVRYIAHGALPNEERYLVMEWVEGENLDERLSGRGLDLAETVELAKHVADALAVAHERGVVHRDLKPANLLLSDGRVDRVKIIDFGIARRVRDIQKLTRTGQVIGSPGYFSPEQAIGAVNVDERADIFALGCVLYECLTGRPAFAAAYAYATLAMVLMTEPDAIVGLAPEVPIELEALIDRMLAKVADQRPRDANALRAELAQLGPMPSGGPRRPRSGESQHTQIADEPPDHVRQLAELTDFIVMATTSGDGLAPGEGEDAGLAPDDPRMADLRATGERRGARVEALIDGSLLAVLSGPRANAENAAQLALELRALLPDAPMMVAAAGRGERLADVIDLNARALQRDELSSLFAADAASEAPPVGAIRLHDAVADALDDRFEIVTGTSGRHLVGERSILSGR